MSDPVRSLLYELEPDTITLEEYRRHRDLPAVHHLVLGQEKTDR